MKRWARTVLPAEKANRNLQQELLHLHDTFLSPQHIILPVPLRPCLIPPILCPCFQHTVSQPRCSHVLPSRNEAASSVSGSAAHPSSAESRVFPLSLFSPLPFPCLAEPPSSLVQPCLELQKAFAELHSSRRETTHCWY